MVTFQTTQKGPLGESDLILAGFAKLDFVNRVEFQRAQHVVVTEMLIFHIEPIASSSLPLVSLLSLSSALETFLEWFSQFVNKWSIVFCHFTLYSIYMWLYTGTGGSIEYSMLYFRSFFKYIRQFLAIFCNGWSVPHGCGKVLKSCYGVFPPIKHKARKRKKIKYSNCTKQIFSMVLPHQNAISSEKFP